METLKNKRGFVCDMDTDMSRRVTGTVWFIGFAFAIAFTALSGYSAVWGRLGSRIRPSLIAARG